MAIELIGTLLVVAVALVAATAVLTGWFVLSATRGTLRTLFRRPADAPPTLPITPATLCSRPTCRAPNPTHAHFCRRCGHQLVTAKRFTARAAVW